MNDSAKTDTEHLRLLTIGYYVVAGLNFFFGLFPLIHVGIGLAMVTGKMPMGSGHAGAPFGPASFGWLFVAMGVIVILVAQTTAVLNLIAARSLAGRRRRTFCMIVAGLNCMSVPIGTLIGVFTFIVLGRENVRAQFDAAV
jgi:hypothetical protein